MNSKSPKRMPQLQVISHRIISPAATVSIKTISTETSAEQKSEQGLEHGEAYAGTKEK